MAAFALVPTDLDEILAAIRDEASAATWSKGVQLARTDAVVGVRQRGGELELRVALASGAPAVTVQLLVEDADWACDCRGAGDACEHVCASVIAVRQAAKEGRSLFEGGAAAAALAYELTSSGGDLAFARQLGGQLVPSGALAGLVEQGRAVADQADWRVERVLGGFAEGPVPKALVMPLLEALASVEHLTLDGKPVRVGDPACGLVVVVEDCAEGFRVRVEQDPGVTRVLGNGALLKGGVLSAIDDSPAWLTDLRVYRGGKVFRAADVAHLVAEVLPRFERHMPVRLATSKLPGRKTERPRMLFETRGEGDALAVMPLVVYGDPPCARVDGERLTLLGNAVPVRDEAAERRLIRELHERTGMAVGSWSRGVREVGVRMAEAMAHYAQDMPAAFRGDAHRAFERVHVALDAEVSFAQGFDVQFRGGARTASAGAVLEAWQRGDSLVALEGGGYAPLPHGWLEQHGHRVLALLSAKADAARLPTATLPAAGALARELGVAEPPELGPLMDALDRAEDALPWPAELAATLRPYQRTGAAWLMRLRLAGLGAVLADDMGLGKTLQALVAAGTPALVVAPTSVMGNWLHEIAKFRPGLTARLYHGPARSLEAPADVLVTSYGVLRQDADLLAQRRFVTVILDEAQAIKNPQSQVAQSAAKLQGATRYLLSGTPVENRPEELWSLMRVANPGLLGTLGEFRRRFAAPMMDPDPALHVPAAASLRSLLGPFVLRRLKREVAKELPARTEVVLRCRLGDAERATYDTVRAASSQEVMARLEQGGSVLEALEALLRLRQAACHGALLPGQTAQTSAKLELLGHKLEELLAEGHKALVFSQWTSFLDLIGKSLLGAGIDYLRLDGSTRDRDGVVQAFQSEERHRVMLISLRAGGTGLTLTAADHVFLMDPWWNPAVEDQAADRVHRIGQDKPVLIYRVVAEDTVEERLLALQERKRAMADAALGEAHAAASLTREDLAGLLA